MRKHEKTEKHQANPAERLIADTFVRAHASNENKMSDGGRGCAWLAVNGWKSSEM
jgi:hypothetical protein